MNTTRILLILLAALTLAFAACEDGTTITGGDDTAQTSEDTTPDEDTSTTTDATTEEDSTTEEDTSVVEDTTPDEDTSTTTDATEEDTADVVVTPTCDDSGFEPANTTATFDTDGVILSSTSAIDDLDLQNALTIELRAGGSAALDAPGTYALGTTEDALDYATCDVCLTFSIDCDIEGCGRYHLAESGTLEITELSDEGSPVKARLTNVVVREITFDSVGSIFVEGGATWCLDGVALSTE